MKRFVLALVLVPASVLIALGADQGKKSEGKKAERVVIVPQDTTPFSVGMNQQVRLTGMGIAGSKIVASLDGPAEIVAENSILTMKGGQLLIGMTRGEFEIQPTGKGMIKARITSTPPQPNARPIVTNYQFEVK